MPRSHVPHAQRPRARSHWPTPTIVSLLLIAALVSGGGIVGAQQPSESPPATSGPSIDITAPLAGPGVLPTDETSVEIAESIETDQYTSDTEASVISALAASGIAVLDQPRGSPIAPVAAPVSPLRFLEAQVRGMALEAWARGGSSGADLDATVLVPSDAPLASSVLAAWLAASDTPRGRLARALMAGQDVTDPTTLVYPGLVLSLFTADVVDAGSGVSRSGESAMAWRVAENASGAGATAAGICSSVQSFVDNVIKAVFSALKAHPPASGVGAVVVSVWNWLVDRGADFVRSLIKALEAPVIAVIQLIAGTLSEVVQTVAALLPYELSVTAIPGHVTLPPDPGPGVTGQFQVQVTAEGSPDWPPILADCATASGVTLPTFRPNGQKVVWGPLTSDPPGLVLKQNADPALDASGRAQLTFQTRTEPPEVANGEKQDTLVELKVTIQRDDVKQARERVRQALTHNLPPIVKDLVDDAFAPLVAGLEQRIDRLLDPTKGGVLFVTYHTKPATPQPSVSPEPSGCQGGGTIPPGSYDGTLVVDQDLTMANGRRTITSHGTGHVSFRVDDKEQASGSWTLTANEVISGDATGQVTATVAGGSIAGDSSQLEMKGTWKFQGVITTSHGLQIDASKILPTDADWPLAVTSCSTDVAAGLSIPAAGSTYQLTATRVGD